MLLFLLLVEYLLNRFRPDVATKQCGEFIT
jgi:hypothetical protein